MTEIESQYIWVVDPETGFGGEVLLNDYAAALALNAAAAVLAAADPPREAT